MWGGCGVDVGWMWGGCRVDLGYVDVGWMLWQVLYLTVCA